MLLVLYEIVSNELVKKLNLINEQQSGMSGTHEWHSTTDFEIEQIHVALSFHYKVANLSPKTTCSENHGAIDGS